MANRYKGYYLEDTLKFWFSFLGVQASYHGKYSVPYYSTLCNFFIFFFHWNILLIGSETFILVTYLLINKISQ